MADAGWIKLHRGITDHWLWDCEFSYAQAWIDLLLKACHKPNKLMIKGQLVELKRGQQARSEVTLSKEWKWSRGKVRRFINQCEKDGMIECKATHLTSIITICNYDSFQGVDTSGGTASDTTGDTANGQQTVHKQEVKNLRSKESTMSSELDDGVSAVIEKINSITGKKLMASTKAHRENISARLREGHSVQELISVVEVKAAEWMGTKYEAYLVPSTLFTPKNFARYLAESSIAARTMTAEEVVQSYHDELPEMPSVDYITRELRASITEFCLKSGFNAAKLKKYFDYIRSSCGWVMDERYRKDFRFLINLETLNRAMNGTLSNRSD